MVLPRHFFREDIQIQYTTTNIQNTNTIYKYFANENKKRSSTSSAREMHIKPTMR